MSDDEFDNSERSIFGVVIEFTPFTFHLAVQEHHNHFN